MRFSRQMRRPAAVFADFTLLLFSALLVRSSPEESAMTASLARVVYVTAPTELVARNISKSIIQSRLAACVNIVPGITSMFTTNGTTKSKKAAKF
ncbi:hypothetical protein L596_014882 [Steinernema carpocapsae]|uniref:Secreted protein n=1 Tax=Steinernema carpocapsae TaxID=34508 RepID=A0A4U5NDH5_STECR|nr:hypothetical protein L596_014882 [Steinernema carpocapsae]